MNTPGNKLLPPLKEAALENLFVQECGNDPLRLKVFTCLHDSKCKGSRKNNFTLLALRFRLGLVDFKEQKAQ
jgi:hypothetical protein